MNKILNYLISLLLPTMFGFVGCKQPEPDPILVPMYGVYISDSLLEERNEITQKQMEKQQDSLAEIISETTELQ